MKQNMVVHRDKVLEYAKTYWNWQNGAFNYYKNADAQTLSHHTGGPYQHT